MLTVPRARVAAAGLLVLVLHGPDSTSPGLLVSANWLNAHLHDTHLVILEIGPGNAYSIGHIPGARAITIRDIIPTPPADSDAKMLPEAALKQMLAERFGISDQSQVVVVSDSGWYSAGTRIMLTLQYVGLGEHSALLDGGAAAWRNAGYPVSTDTPTAPTPGRISSAPVLGHLIVNHEYVAAHARAPKARLIDAREAACFNATCGAEVGHLPGATSLPMEALFDDAGMFKSKADLAALFHTAGVQAGDTVVAYCHTGFRSTAVLLAARLLGHPIKNYDGSLRDWRRRGLPTEAVP